MQFYNMGLDRIIFVRNFDLVTVAFNTDTQFLDITFESYCLPYDFGAALYWNSHGLLKNVMYRFNTNFIVFFVLQVYHNVISINSCHP